MKTKTALACVGLGFAVAVGAVLSRNATGGDDDVEGVKTQCKAFVAAWNKHDPKALAALFAEDGDHIDPMTFVKDEGRPAIEKMLTGMHGAKGPMHDSSLVVNVEIVRFPSSETAVSDADVTMSGIAGPDGSKAPPMDFHVTNVWKKVGGTWWVYSCRPYAKPPPPAAPPTK